MNKARSAGLVIAHSYTAVGLLNIFLDLIRIENFNLYIICMGLFFSWTLFQESWWIRTDREGVFDFFCVGVLIILASAIVSGWVGALFGALLLPIIFINEIIDNPSA